MNQQTAQGLASFGRGPDSMLVHMAPGEVRSLQQLAMAHGGSLTINPETGLPEAGFLSSLLPMLIGGGLTVASGGALSPLMAGLITGGGYGLATGSLKKGLMAGFGAYGGAGLGSALAGAGATQGLIAGNAASQTAMGGAANAKDLLLARGAETAAPGMFGNAATNFSNAGAGITGLGSEAGRNAFMTQIGGAKGLGMAGLAAAAPMMMETTTKQPEIKTDANMGQRYQFNAGTQTPTPVADVPGYENQGINFGKEQRYFNPSYKQIDNDAARKLYGYASGGPVEDMSNANAIGMNTGYPQSGIRTGAYATPDQRPISRDMLPYAGQPQFAEGGAVDSYTYDPTTQLYVKKSGEGATTASPTGGASRASGEGTTGISSNPEWENMTPAQQADFYANNPIFSAITQAGQNIFGYTTPGMLQNAMVPGFQALQAAIAAGGTQAAVPVEDAGTYVGVNPLGSSVPVEDAGSYVNVNPFGAANVAQGDSAMEAVEAGAAAEAAGVDTGAIAKGGLISLAQGGLSALAQGGISNLGDYSDGGRLLRGPGDGISDSIPAMIGKKQPARLADGEFVVPARIVSELGNGSTEAGARKLYAMMERVQKARKKTVGKGKVAANSRSAKYLPA
jgi:hypothetical protein